MIKSDYLSSQVFLFLRIFGREYLWGRFQIAKLNCLAMHHILFRAIEVAWVKRKKCASLQPVLGASSPKSGQAPPNSGLSPQ
jgi:hypothetical protein